LNQFIGEEDAGQVEVDASPAATGREQGFGCERKFEEFGNARSTVLVSAGEWGDIQKVDIILTSNTTG
jgi:hypothetical protein